MIASSGGIGIAVVGIAARLPGASSITEFRKLVRSGHSALRRFSEDELRKAGISAARLNHPQFVPVKGTIDDADCFDYGFFRMSPALARAMDPQHRLFLQCCWHALEDAGLSTDAAQRRIGVFAGASAASSYYHEYVSRDPEVAQVLDSFQLYIINQPAALSNQVSFYFDLTGPSVTVQTACSTGLAAIVNACQSLIDFQCDAALAGAATVTLPLVGGYVAPPGSILSPSGRCLPFDDSADGTVSGDGVAAVVLKRLDDAMTDRDRIYAVIRGYGISNDGARKVGFSAPSADGQAAAIAEAIAMAEIEPPDIGFVEAHGTGTSLGDAIEIAALSDVFAGCGRGMIPLGAVKAQVGHLEVTAGLAGFIKAVIAVEEGIIPPISGAMHAKPDIASSPFRIPKVAEPWTAERRCAGVSSFGMGGTNVHLIIEQPPTEPDTLRDEQTPAWTAMPLSAPSADRLSRMADELASFMKTSPAPNLADVGTTLARRLRAFDHRMTVVASTVDDAIGQLRDGGVSAVAKTKDVVFAFTGQGSQQVGLARLLYRASPSFAAALDECRADLAAFDCDIDPYLFGTPSVALDERMADTEIAQPTLFSFAYAYAAMLRAWGLLPSAMIGHSLGEYVALCLAGVMSRRDALSLVVERGRAIQAAGPGAMLAVAATAAVLQRYLDPECEIAAYNGPSQLVVAGEAGAIDALAVRLADDGITARGLASRRAFHSSWVTSSLARISDAARQVALRAPQIPVASNLSGHFFTADQPPEQDYFARQTRAPVCFGAGVKTLIDAGHSIFLEIGAGSVLTGLIRANAGEAALTTVPVMPRPNNGRDVEQALQAAAAVWAAGAVLDWRAVDIVPKGQVISLPGYPFARTRCWVSEPAVPDADTPPPLAPSVETHDPDDITSAIIAVWTACLGHQRIEANDDYHRLGGDSLTAVRIAERLSNRIGVAVRPNDLLQAPTPRSLSALIAKRRSGAGTSDSAVIDARTAERCDDLLVLFHPIGGTVHLYGELIAALPDSQSIRLVQALPFAGQGPQPESIEAMTQRYLVALQLDCNTYVHFAGASLGGLIAFEAARQWAGPASVIMLDSAAPGAIAAAIADESDALAFMARLMGQPIAAEELRLLSADRRRQRIVDMVRVIDELDDDRAQQFVDVFRTNAQAMNTYRPTPSDTGPVTLVAAKTRDYGQPSDPEEGWRLLTRGRMAVEIVPGGHLSMLTAPNVEVTARAVARAMGLARERSVRLARAAS